MSVDMEQMVECYTGLTEADFELGDRFYSRGLSGEMKLGTVQSSGEGEIVILWDDGTDGRFVPAPGNDMADRLMNCGKPLDLTQLEVGSIISQFMDGNRHYAEVTKYIFGKEVVAVFTAPPNLPLTMKATERVSLEKKMAYWELEG